MSVQRTCRENTISSSSSQDGVEEDGSIWVQSVVDYVKDTESNDLDLSVSSYIWEVVDIKPILDSLVGSTITEVHLKNQRKISDLSKILLQSTIDTLNLSSCELKGDDLLSLITILKHTQITELHISGLEDQLKDSQLDEFLTQLASSRLRCLKLHNSRIFPLRKVHVILQRLLVTQLSCLDLSNVFFENTHFCCVFCAKPLKNTLISSSQYTALTDLNLKNNIMDDSSAKVVGHFLKTANLKKLDLRANIITDSGVDFLVAGLIESEIRYLNLKANKIKGNNGLGHSLESTKIRELDLSENPLTSQRIFARPYFLIRSNVVTLKLCHSVRKNEMIPVLIRELRFSGLICLDLSSCDLNLEHIPALADVLSHSNISHVDLSVSRFSDDSFSILGLCLKSSVLKRINLCRTVSSPRNVRGISSFLRFSKGSLLNAVSLRFNHFEVDKIAPSLANTTIQELDLSFNRCHKYFASLAPQLKSTAITALYLIGSEIEDIGAAVLAKYLVETRIVVLNLSCNRISNHGAKSMALALKMTKLRYLNLRQNRIQDLGLEYLAEHVANSCITHLNVEGNAGTRKLLVYSVLWRNRKKIQQFADLLRRTAFFTGDSNIFEFDRDFGCMDVDVFIDDCLKIYKTVSEEPYIIGAIEQDKRIVDLKKVNCCDARPWAKDGKDELEICFADCEQIYKTILDFPSSFPLAANKAESDFFRNKLMWLVMDYFPAKLVSFIGGSVEASLEQHVSLLKKAEEMRLCGIVERLLLNRPLFMIDKKENILHPFVYKLLYKYKQTICNTDIERECVKKIVTYFTNHADIDGASEITLLLNDSNVMKHV